MKKKRLLGGLFFLAAFAAGIAITMLLWNALIPSIIGWTAINYWQAAGLLILSRLMFGGFGRMKHFGRHRGHWDKDRRRQHTEFHEKMRGMSKDERLNYIRERMRMGDPFGDRPFGKEDEDDCKKG